MGARFRIEPLSDVHDRTRFQSGSEPLDRYLREQASQDTRRHLSTCFVAVEVQTGVIAGYYTLTATNIPLDQLSAEIAKRLPRYPVVLAALLGRLAIHRHHQGKGLGSALLGDAIVRVARSELGVFAIVVDAKDVSAQRFYEHYGFTLLAGETRRLCLPIATALHALEDPKRK
ncbi:MAG TPA: GNAT family N-acetyltransferase [Bryobacteraceae bacterium]|nr:GNAT family N-acetyltransferase [Bryobacteraceae bacterium]